MGLVGFSIAGLQSFAVAGWLALDVDMLRTLIVALWIEAGAYFNAVVAFLFSYGKEIVGLLGGTYGILKWWYYREAVLHERLKTYLAREDQRLKNARRDILYTIARPGEHRRFTEPKFAVEPLRKVLRRRRFNSRWSWQTPESAADRLLDEAARQIGKRMEVLEASQKAYREQAVTAHIFKGVIAGLKAQRGFGNEALLRASALQEYRTALAVPGNDHRLFALEQLGHQLRCLGLLDDAVRAYECLAAEVENQLDGRERDMKLADAWRWGAIVHQAKRWFDNNPGRGSQSARDLIGATQELSGALLLRSRHGPFQEWEAIEQGDFEYITAFVAHNLNSYVIRDARLDGAEVAYKNALPVTSRPWLLRGKKRMLYKAASAGLRRVGRLKSDKGDFDTEWLLPRQQKSDEPQSPPEPVGGA